MPRKVLAPTSDDRIIPSSVRRDDLLAAMSPLLDLLGISADEVTPSLTIDEDCVRFSVVVPASGGGIEFTGVGGVPSQGGYGGILTVPFSVGIS